MAIIPLLQKIYSNLFPTEESAFGSFESLSNKVLRKIRSLSESVFQISENTIESVKEGNDRKGNKTYLLQLTDKHNNTLMVELSGDGTYWNINTAGVFKTSYGKNRKEVYNRHTTAKQSAETAETSQSGEQSGTQTLSSMMDVSTPVSSESKDSNNFSKNKEILVNPSTGLIANDLSAQLTEDFAASLDAVAKAFGLRVKFVHLASEGKANAEIEGNEVRIAWKARGKAIPFLVGHEFTHRMQDLSPEEYNAFKGAVIKYLGEEEWNARIAEIKDAYDKQAVAYTETLIEDEAVADFVGELIEDADSFDLFIAQNAKEGWFKRFIEALKALFSKLSKTDIKAELYKDMLDKLGAMVSKATEVATEHEAETMREGVMQGQPKFSMSDETTQIFDAAKAKFGTTYDMVRLSIFCLMAVCLILAADTK